MTRFCDSGGNGVFCHFYGLVVEDVSKKGSSSHEYFLVSDCNNWPVKDPGNRAERSAPSVLYVDNAEPTYTE